MKIMKPANPCSAGSTWIIRNFAEAGQNDEYLLGKDILVAPVLQGSLQVVPGEWLKTPDGQPGLKAEFFTNEDLSGTPALTRTDADVDFNWDTNSPAPDFPRTHFSARWTGTIEVPAAIGDVTLATPGRRRRAGVG